MDFTFFSEKHVILVCLQLLSLKTMSMCIHDDIHMRLLTRIKDLKSAFSAHTQLTFLHLVAPHQLSSVLGVEVTAVGVGTCQEHLVNKTPASLSTQQRTALDSDCVHGCWARAVLRSGFSIVDANTSAVVGPRMEVQTGCGCDNTSPPIDSACTPYTCLNGGRCVPTLTGTK